MYVDNGVINTLLATVSYCEEYKVLSSYEVTEFPGTKIKNQKSKIEKSKYLSQHPPITLAIGIGIEFEQLSSLFVSNVPILSRESSDSAEVAEKVTLIFQVTCNQIIRWWPSPTQTILRNNRKISFLE